jgi:Protein of unknown function (DUF998)
MTTDRYEGHATTSSRLATRAFVVSGIVAGPLYVAATMAQALTRDGFDWTANRFTSLTTGELGWIHQASMMLVGTLTMLFALGASDLLRNGRAARVTPWLIALFGAAYAFGGALTADPVLGFPPGTTQDMVVATLQSQIQNASRSVSTLLLFALSIAVAVALWTEGRKTQAILAAAAVPVIFSAIVATGLAIGTKTVGVAYLATPWVWTTGLALYLFGRQET